MMPEPTSFEKARAGMSCVFDGFPKGKFTNIMPHAVALEQGMNEMAKVLTMLRSYFIDNGGEDQPFVRAIDKVVPRPKPKAPPEKK